MAWSTRILVYRDTTSTVNRPISPGNLAVSKILIRDKLSEEENSLKLFVLKAMASIQ